MVIRVLYTRELEPITCIKIPIEVQEEIERRGSSRVPVHQNNSPSKFMRLECVRIVMPHSTEVFIVTPDEELALHLDAEFLPGQLPKTQMWQRVIEKQNQLLKQRPGGEPG